MVVESTMSDEEILGKFQSGEWTLDRSMNPAYVMEGGEGVEVRVRRVATNREVMLLLRNQYTDLTEADSAEQLEKMLDSAVDQVPFDTVVHTFEAALDLVITRCRAIMIERQRKYGSGNIAEFGEVGTFMRLRDKNNRMKNAYFHQNGTPRPEPIDTFGDDTLDDAWLDTANYGMIGLMLRMGIWGLPMEEPNG